jgi:hypothetical protein
MIACLQRGAADNERSQKWSPIGLSALRFRNGAPPVRRGEAGLVKHADALTRLPQWSPASSAG